MSNSIKNKSEASLYFPGLNGIRALASLIVLIAHLDEELLKFELEILNAVELGRFAVSIFFALSGFLITYLLLMEKAKTGTISIKDFYIRRMLRIWPLYFIYLLIALGLGKIMGFDFAWWALWLTIFFAPNVPGWRGQHIVFTEHYWSLGVEEQFYLFWPWLLRQSKHAGIAILSFLVGFYVIKLGFRFGLGGFSFPYVIMHLARFDCMAIGGLGAWLLWKGIPAHFQKVIFHPATQIAVWLGLIFILSHWMRLFTFIEHQLVAFFTTLLILNVTSNPKPILRLEGKTWTFLGSISFGLYVWHPILIQNFSAIFLPLEIPNLPKQIIYITVSIAISILMAYISLRLIEKPFLKFKNKFAHVATKSRV